MDALPVPPAAERPGFGLPRPPEGRFPQGAPRSWPPISGIRVSGDPALRCADRRHARASGLPARSRCCGPLSTCGGMSSNLRAAVCRTMRPCSPGSRPCWWITTSRSRCRSAAPAELRAWQRSRGATPASSVFIRAKSEGGLWTANNSVMVDAAFWQGVHAAQEGSEAPMDCRALAVFEEATRCAYINGEPGFINGDQLEDHRTGIRLAEAGVRRWTRRSLGPLCGRSRSIPTRRAVAPRLDGTLSRDNESLRRDHASCHRRLLRHRRLRAPARLPGSIGRTDAGDSP